MAAEKCQKVCFGGQEIVETLYSHYNIPLKGMAYICIIKLSSSSPSICIDCLQWSLLDLHIGCWLLDSDHPPRSFVDCCQFLSVNHSDEVVCTHACMNAHTQNNTV